MNEIIKQINELTDLVNGFAKEYPNDNRLTSQAEILQKVQKIIHSETKKFNGCDYCNTTQIKSMIGYKYMKFCPRCGKELLHE